MGLGFEASSYEAVFFTDGHTVVREMLFTEFEALLDGMFTDPEFRDSACHGVYVKIDKKLNVVGAVCFILNFGDQGQADPKWNVSLMSLLEQATTTVQVAGRDIAIASYSHCPIANQRDELWDPDLSGQHNVITVIVNAVSTNKLGLLVSESASDGGAKTAVPSSMLNSTLSHASKNHAATSSGNSKLALGSVSQDDLVVERRRRRSAKFMRGLRERQRALMRRFQRDVDIQAKKVQREACELNERIEQLERNLFEHQITQEKSERELEKQRVEQEKLLDDAANKHATNHEKLRRQLRQDLQQRLIEETSELQAKLDMREVEIHYREEQISRLQQQLIELSTVDPSLTQPVGTFADLERQGVRYQIDVTGLSPMPLPASDVAKFHSSPERFVADQLKMDLQLFRHWQTHVERPVCTANQQGVSCGQLIETVTADEFVSGVSDRCSDHKVRPASIVGDRHMR